jgi:cytochrome d ubiquinol oxidase subunit II
MNLSDLWFGILCALWSAYLVTEGFDFGIGMLVPVLGRREQDRVAMFQAIGPLWDGNEVWLIIAGAATFAAFPQWYATMFSGFYVALLLVLVLLIIRIVSFEWRAKSADARWRRVWTWANVIASYGAPLVWGIGLSSLLYGTPIGANQEFTGSFWSLFTPYTVAAGLVLVVLCALHGAVFLGLRSGDDDLADRAWGIARRLVIPAAVVAVGFCVATLAVGMHRNGQGATRGVAVLVLAAVAAVTAVLMVRSRRPGPAFLATAATITLAVVMLFAELYPRVMVSSTSGADSLTVANSSSGHYTLAVMTIATALLLPIVAIYQAWTYRVFRVRITGGPPPRSPADVLRPREDDRGGRPPGA